MRAASSLYHTFSLIESLSNFVHFLLYNVLMRVFLDAEGFRCMLFLRYFTYQYVAILFVVMVVELLWIHCQYLGNSIVCDPIYGDDKPILLSTLKKKFKLSKLAEAEKPLLNRLALHSHQLNFSFNNQLYQLEAPIPKDLRAMLQQLRKNG